MQVLITKKEVKPLLAGSIPWMPRQKLRPVYKQDQEYAEAQNETSVGY